MLSGSVLYEKFVKSEQTITDGDSIVKNTVRKINSLILNDVLIASFVGLFIFLIMFAR